MVGDAGLGQRSLATSQRARPRTKASSSPAWRAPAPLAADRLARHAASTRRPRSSVRRSVSRAEWASASVDHVGIVGTARRHIKRVPGVPACTGRAAGRRQRALAASHTIPRPFLLRARRTSAPLLELRDDVRGPALQRRESRLSRSERRQALLQRRLHDLRLATSRRRRRRRAVPLCGNEPQRQGGHAHERGRYAQEAHLALHAQLLGLRACLPRGRLVRVPLCAEPPALLAAHAQLLCLRAGSRRRSEVRLQGARWGCAAKVSRGGRCVRARRRVERARVHTRTHTIRHGHRLLACLNTALPASKRPPPVPRPRQ
jgi:hypothetical protein